MFGLSGTEMKSALNDMPLIKDGDAVLDVTRTEENGGLKYTIEFNSTLGMSYLIISHHCTENNMIYM